MLHVNHRLRPGAADQDEAFTAQLAELLGIPCSAARSMSPARRSARAATWRPSPAASGLPRRQRGACKPVPPCRRASVRGPHLHRPHRRRSRGELLHALHGGHRAGRLPRHEVRQRPRRPPAARRRPPGPARLRAAARAGEGLPCACDADGCLWREDATNAHTDRFRAYVRHEVIPHVKERSPQLLEVLGRTMNLIADEDDMLEEMAYDLVKRHMAWNEALPDRPPAYDEGGVLAPELGTQPVPLQASRGRAGAAGHAGPRCARRDRIGRCGAGGVGRARPPQAARTADTLRTSRETWQSARTSAA